MAEKPPEEGYISVVDEEPEILELLKWDTSHTQKQDSIVLEKEKNQDKRVSKPESDPFDLIEPTFIETYRLTKDLARNLIEELKPVMPASTKTVEFSIESKVLAALSFYATGKFQKSIMGKSEPSATQYFVSMAVLQVTEALNHPSIVKKHIHFPHLKNERDIVKARFYMKYGIPNVIGCVDCTHVPISRPEDNPKLHFNKSYHSKKAQIVCDSDLNITNVYATPGGSDSHDSILNRHGVRVDLITLNQNGEQCWILGGPHYTQMPYLMTPISKVPKKTPISPEKNYANMHTQAFSAITDTMKHLKSRWKVLQATCNKQFDHVTVSMIIVACCVLHNICNKRGLPVVPMTQAEERLEAMKQKVANGPVPRKQVENESGIRTRATLVDRLWNERRLPDVPPKKRAKKDKVIEPPPLPPPQPPPIQAPPQPPQIHPHHQTHQIHHHNHHEDLSKRPRIMTLTPTYGLNVPPAPVWGHHYPHH